MEKYWNWWKNFKSESCCEKFNYKWKEKIEIIGEQIPSLKLTTHLSRNTRKWANAKNKKCIAGYFVPLMWKPKSPLHTIREQQRNRGEMTKKQRRRIVYKRCLPCFANRVFTVRCTQDLHRGSGLVDKYKVFFLRKIDHLLCENWWRTTNSVQQHVRLVFVNNILFGEKIISSPIRHVCE